MHLDVFRIYDISILNTAPIEVYGHILCCTMCASDFIWKHAEIFSCVLLQNHHSNLRDTYSIMEHVHNVITILIILFM